VITSEYDFVSYTDIILHTNRVNITLQGVSEMFNCIQEEPSNV